MNRRGFLFGLPALAAPAIIRTPGLLMPVSQARLRPAMTSREPSDVLKELLSVMSRDAASVSEQLFMDQITFGISATRHTALPPFIERIDPREFLSPKYLVSPEVFSL